MTTIVYQGVLYRYGTDSLFSVKKFWKQCFVVLTEDSTFSAYKNDTLKTKLYETKLAENTLWLAFGKDAEKYNPPKCTDGAIDMEYNYLIAIPKNKDREMVAWFAAESQYDFKQLIHAMALTVKSTSKPPVLGGKRYENRNIAERMRHIFNLGPDAEKWELYWLAGSLGESGSDFSKPPTPLSTPLPYRVQMPPSTPVSQRSELESPLPQRYLPPSPASSRVMVSSPPIVRRAPVAPDTVPNVSRDEIVGTPVLPVKEFRPPPPVPSKRKSVLLVKPMQLTEENVEKDKKGNCKTVHTTTIIIVGKGVEKLPTHQESPTKELVVPVKIHYDTTSPTEVKEIVTEESNWCNGYLTGKTIRTVECITTKLNKDI